METIKHNLENSSAKKNKKCESFTGKSFENLLARFNNGAIYLGKFFFSPISSLAISLLLILIIFLFGILCFFSFFTSLYFTLFFIFSIF